MRLDELPQVVNLHMESFPGFFLSFLGPDFLSLFYRSVHEDPEGVLLVACTGTTIVGVSAAVENQAAFYRRMLRRKWAFGRAALAAVIEQPAITLRLVRALNKPVEVQASVADACILSLAVLPEYRDQGFGEQLVDAVCRELTKRDAEAVCLTTDRVKNDAVNRFYQRIGFRLARTFVTPEGRALNEYLLPLRSPSAALLPGGSSTP
jgi:ribosomal protein S18 acetylase RimI-like enzyme